MSCSNSRGQCGQGFGNQTVFGTSQGALILLRSWETEVGIRTGWWLRRRKAEDRLGPYFGGKTHRQGYETLGVRQSNSQGTHRFVFHVPKQASQWNCLSARWCRRAGEKARGKDHVNIFTSGHDGRAAHRDSKLDFKLALNL